MKSRFVVKAKTAPEAIILDLSGLKKIISISFDACAAAAAGR